MPLILEGIVTTTDNQGVVNIAPMGPIVDPSMQSLHFRPFQTSTTYQNLKQTGIGVFHVTDDVEMITKAATGQLAELPELLPCKTNGRKIIASACRWYAFEVESIDDSSERTEIQAKVVDQGRLRDYFGLNRAKHAIVEAAILSTRIHLLEANSILNDFENLSVLIEKTGGEPEYRAFALLKEYVQKKLSDTAGTSHE